MSSRLAQLSRTAEMSPGLGVFAQMSDSNGVPTLDRRVPMSSGLVQILLEGSGQAVATTCHPPVECGHPIK